MKMAAISEQVQRLEAQVDLLMFQAASRYFGNLYPFIRERILAYSDVLDLTKRAALVMRDIYLVHKVHVTYTDIDLCKELVVKLVPGCSMNGASYLRMLDTCCRRFSSIYDVHYRIGSVLKSAVTFPAVTIVMGVSDRKRKKYDQFCQLFFEDKYKLTFLGEGSCVCTGVPSEFNGFGRDNIRTIYETVKDLVVDDNPPVQKYVAYDPESGARGHVFHIDKQCTTIRDWILRPETDERLLKMNITKQCGACK